MTLNLDSFPSLADLWARHRTWKGLTPEAEQIVLQDYFDDAGGKAPQYIKSTPSMRRLRLSPRARAAQQRF
jgi:hypothetical protein